jgi:Glycosyl hydrolases family 2, TIM barrel domain
VRRNLLKFATGLIMAATIPALLSSSQKKSSPPIRKRNLPFYLGWYDFVANPSAPGLVSSKGIDLIMPYLDILPNPAMDEATKQKISVFLDAAKAAKIKVLVEIYRPLVELENISGVKNFINTYKNHPSVAGWYLYDEPEIKKPQPLSPDSLTRVYRAIKEEDRSKPVAIAFGDTDKIEVYSNAMDILMWDKYPCEEGMSEFQWIAAYREPLRKVASIAEAKQKKFWNILQAYSGHGFKRRLPSNAEFRYMFYSSILAGSDALLFWMHPWSTNDWNESVLYPMIREVRRYIPAIVNKGSQKIGVSDYSDVEIELFSFPNSRKKLILAVNHNRNRVISNIKLDRQLAYRRVRINNQNVDRISARSNFRLTLNPFEVKLHEII